MKTVMLIITNDVNVIEAGVSTGVSIERIIEPTQTSIERRYRRPKTRARRPMTRARRPATRSISGIRSRES